MQCICRMVAGRCARCRVAGWGQQCGAHCDLGHASTSRRVQQPAQPSIGQQEVSSMCRIMYIIMLLLLSTGRSLQSGSRVLELVCTGWLCCPWSEFSDILHDGVQALWYMVHAPSLHRTHTPPTGGPHTHQTKVKADKLTEILTKCTFRQNSSYHYNDMM